MGYYASVLCYEIVAAFDKRLARWLRSLSNFWLITSRVHYWQTSFRSGRGNARVCGALFVYLFICMYAVSPLCINNKNADTRLMFAIQRLGPASQRIPCLSIYHRWPPSRPDAKQCTPSTGNKLFSRFPNKASSVLYSNRKNCLITRTIIKPLSKGTLYLSNRIPTFI